jgi:D-beta-D-heptose 7-phosphate kinase / D-beta-D-heptose 1-phosphate adenosyltransferase
MHDLFHWINLWQSRSILLIGDAILDSYLSGHAERLCREAPAPVVAVEQQQDQPGGAANTAANLASLGANVSFLSVIGADSAGERLRFALEQRSVSTAHLIVGLGRTTLSKQRILADEQIVARLDQGSTEPLNADLEQRLIERLTQQFWHCDGIVISDYSYGVITAGLLRVLAELQACQPRPLVIDSRCLQRFRDLRPTAVKPNYEETIRLLGLPRQTQGRAEQILPHRLELLKRTGAQLVAVTLDQEGALGLTADQPPVYTSVTPVPPNQTSGAGDTFVSALTLALAAGAPCSDALTLATTATSVTVQQPHTAVCQTEALHQALLNQSYSNKLILSQTELSQQVQHYRAASRRIVFTNGCFDILHPGHITYLQQAKALGDLLIVGVNSDESVRRLKGENRPVNALADRLTLLAALGVVDHVVPFNELNPNHLIRAICPDLYVKGGDYSRDTLPEVELVEELGGEVRILPYVENRSTTKLIEQIRALQY